MNSWTPNWCLKIGVVWEAPPLPPKKPYTFRLGLGTQELVSVISFVTSVALGFSGNLASVISVLYSAFSSLVWIRTHFTVVPN